MKTWIILDLVAIGVLLLGWMVWKARGRRLARAAAAETTVRPVAPTTRLAPDASEQARGEPVAAATATDTEARVEVDEEPTDVDTDAGPDVGDEHEAGAELGDDAALEDADEPSEAGAAEADDRVAGDDMSHLQVILDVAHGKGEEVLNLLRPVLGLPELAGPDTCGGEACVELERTADVTGPLGADRLLFETADAPGLLTSVLTALRDCGYGIEMVVHHEVILHDVDAGVARIRLSQRGGDAEIEGGMPPNSMSDTPMIV